MNISDPKTWLNQKLEQNGFTMEDLSAQTGLSMDTLEKMSHLEKAEGDAWDIVLDVLNNYPVLYLPSSDLQKEIESQISQTDDQEMCTVYYGVNQSELIFAACRFTDGSLHGANVDTQYLRELSLTLKQALDLFRAQAMSIANESLS